MPSTSRPKARSATRCAAIASGAASPFTTSFHTRLAGICGGARADPGKLGMALAAALSRSRRARDGVDASLIAELSRPRASAIRCCGRAAWTRDCSRRACRCPLDLPRPIFLTVGRVAVEKNLEAFLSLDLPGTKVVVGDGPMKPELMQRYPDAVFLGARQRDELAAIYAAADVFVFPSRTDTFGLVMLEALVLRRAGRGLSGAGPARCDRECAGRRAGRGSARRGPARAHDRPQRLPRLCRAT